MHENEPAYGLDHLAHRLPRRLVRRDRSANGDAAILGDFRCDIPDAANVDVAMLLRETELRRKMLADQVAVEQRNRTSARLQELGNERVGDGRFTGAGKAGEEDRHALFVPWRIAAPKLLHYFRIGEPRRDFPALIQALPQFGSGDIEHLRTLRNFIGRDVAVFVLQIHHHLERDHLYAHFRFVLLEQLLRVVRPVKRLAIFVLAGTGVVAADDEVGAAVVLANQPVPDRLAWSAQAHGQGQHRKLYGAVRVFWKQQLVATCSHEIIHVARLGHSYRWMNQQIGFDLLGGAHREFDVRAVHGIARLERNDTDPAEAGKFRAQFGRCQTKGAEIVVRGRLEFLDASPDIPRV